MNRKRRGRGEGSVHYQEDRKRWCGRISLGGSGAKRRRKTVYGKSKQEVLIKLARIRANPRADSLPDAEKMKVATLMERWLAGQVERVSPRTLEDRRDLADKHITPNLGDKNLAKLDADHIQAFFDDMARDGVNAHSRRHSAKCLKAALNFAVKRGWLPHNPCSTVTMPKEPKREMLTLTADQARELMEAAEGRTIHAAIVVSLASGLRQSELLALHWPDIDLDAGTVAVKRVLSRTRERGLFLKEPKSAKSKRTVTLPDFAVAVLVELRKQRLAKGWIAAPVFCSRGGGFMSSSVVNTAFRRVKANAPGVPKNFRWHDQRHTHASLLLAGGSSIIAVANRLGHSDPALTLRVYSHAMPTDDKLCAAGLERMIG